MHSVTIVLLPPPFENLEKRAVALFEPHRLDEQNYKPGWHLDYWTIGDGQQLRDEATERELGIAADDEVLHDNICFVRSFPGNVVASNVVTPDGTWHALTDFGWTWRGRETPEGRDAWERWVAHMRGLFDAHVHCVAIEFDTHS
jgi:hypothetical protein